jgi:hypothetical protein
MVGSTDAHRGAIGGAFWATGGSCLSLIATWAGQI